MKMLKKFPMLMRTMTTALLELVVSVPETITLLLRQLTVMKIQISN